MIAACQQVFNFYSHCDAWMVESDICWHVPVWFLTPVTSCILEIYINKKPHWTTIQLWLLKTNKIENSFLWKYLQLDKSVRMQAKNNKIIYRMSNRKEILSHYLSNSLAKYLESFK